MTYFILVVLLLNRGRHTRNSIVYHVNVVKGSRTMVDARVDALVERAPLVRNTWTRSTTAVLLQFCTAASLWSHACVISAPCFSVQPSQVNEANQSMNSPDSSTLYCITFLDEGTPPQYQYNTSTIPIRYQYNTSAIPVQHQYNTSTIPVQHQYNTSTIPVPDTWYRIANSEPNNRGLLTVCI